MWLKFPQTGELGSELEKQLEKRVRGALNSENSHPSNKCQKFPPPLYLLAIFYRFLFYVLGLERPTWVRQFGTKIPCVLCIVAILLSWILSREFRKRQVMSPSSMVPMPIGILLDNVPTLLLILQWVTAWYIDTAIVFYQFIGTQTCRHTSLSLPLAQDTDFLATQCRFNFACSMHNELAVTIILEFPTSVLPALHGNRVPAQAGAEKLARGSGESHLTRKQTRSRHLPVLLLLLPLHTHTHNCRQEKYLTSAQACARSLDKEKWPQECQLPAVDKLAPPLPTARNCSGMSCSMIFCHTSGLVIEDFTVGTGFLIFGYGGFTLTFTSNCFAHTFPSLSAGRGLSFLPSCDAQRLRPQLGKLDCQKWELESSIFSIEL